MDRKEFIEELRVALSTELDCYEVNDNIAYYDEYIDLEIRKGVSEQDIFNDLGEPRLIAKTIIDKAKMRVNDENKEYKEANGEEKVKKRKIPGWLILILVLLVIFVMTKLAFSLFFKMLPFILVIMAISYIVKLFRS